MSPTSNTVQVKTTYIEERSKERKYGRDFKGKVAFVTGAGSGIGRASALAFAREGASVVVADRSEKGNQETAHLVEQLGGRALAVRCDVTRAEDIKTALDKAVEAFGRLDFAFNNAGSEQPIRQPPILQNRSGTALSSSIFVECFCA